jgi:hypothetical protein
VSSEMTSNLDDGMNGAQETMSDEIRGSVAGLLPY